MSNSVNLVLNELNWSFYRGTVYVFGIYRDIYVSVFSSILTRFSQLISIILIAFLSIVFYGHSFDSLLVFFSSIKDTDLDNKNTYFVVFTSK